MINVDFNKLDNPIKLECEFYNEILRIPINIILRNYELCPYVIRYENLYNRNFIELRFNKDSGDLFDISVISINCKNVEYIKEIDLNLVESQYSCSVKSFDQDSIRDEYPFQIVRSSDSVCFSWGEEDEFIYHKVADELYIGVDSNSNLRSFCLRGLREQDIKDIFGN